MTKSRATANLEDSCLKDRVAIERAISDAIHAGVSKPYIKRILREELVPFSSLSLRAQESLA